LALTATLTTLVSFNGADCDEPFGGLIADANGDLIRRPIRPRGIYNTDFGFFQAIVKQNATLAGDKFSLSIPSVRY
jgi:hypothetical protein